MYYLIKCLPKFTILISGLMWNYFWWISPYIGQNMALNYSFIISICSNCKFVRTWFNEQLKNIQICSLQASFKVYEAKILDMKYWKDNMEY